MLPDLFKKIGTIAGDNSPAILTGVGVTGVVTTAYFTGRASFKAAEIIAREEQKLKDEDPQIKEMHWKDKVRAVWPLYIPPITVGVTTITAIVMGNHEASKRIAALTVASGISERALQEYKAKVVEKLGEKKEMGIRDEIAQDRVTANPPSNSTQIINLGEDGNVLCFDQMTGRYFQSTMEKIRQAENRINYEIINHMYASLSAFYDEIGLAPTPFSDEVGWNGNELFEVKISTVLSPDNRPCLAIDFARAPFVGYTKTWS